jgi:hypothetical protein
MGERRIAVRSRLGLLILQTSRSREEMLYIDLQLAGYHLYFGRGYGLPSISRSSRSRTSFLIEVEVSSKTLRGSL